MARGVKAGKAFVVIEALDKSGMVLKRAAQRFNQFANRIAGIGKVMAGASLAMLAPVAISTKTFASFDDSLRKVEARSTGTAEQMEELRIQAKELGRTTAFTASQIGELQASLAQKGFNRGQIKNMVEGIQDLARAGGGGQDMGADILASGDLVATTLRQFNLEAEESTRLADLFTVAINNSNSNLQSLTDGLKFAGPVAASYNISVDRTVATLAAMRDMGLDASMTGTAFRNMLLKLSDAAGREKFSAALKRMTGNTVEMVDAQGNLKDLPSLLFEIGNATKGLGTAERGKLLADLFGLRAVVAATGLGRAEENFKRLEAAMGNIDGQAKKTAKQMDSGLGGALRKFWSALEGTQIALGEALADPLQELGTRLNTFLEGVAKWIEKNQGLVQSIIQAVAWVGMIGLGLVALAGIFKVLAIAMGVVGTVLSIVKAGFLLLLSPVGLVIASIALVVGLLWKFSQTFRDVVSGIANKVGAAFSEIGNIIKGTFQGIIDSIMAGDLEGAFEIATSGLYLVWLELSNKIKTVWEDVVSVVVAAWEGAMAGIKNAWFSAQKSIADGMLSLAEQSGIVGDALDILIGMDVSDEKARGERLDAQLAEIKRKKGEDPSGIRDSFDTSREQMREGFDKKIDDAWEAAGASVNEVEAGIAAMRTARRKEIEDRKRELETKVLQAAEKRKAMEAQKALDQEANDQAAEHKSKFEEMLSGLAPGGIAIGGKISKGLEKGTVEAAKQAYANQQTQIASQQLGVAKEQLEEQRKTNEKLDNQGLVGVG